MPELPEVAVLARDLSEFSADRKVTAVTLNLRHPFFKKIVSQKARALLNGLIGYRSRISSIGKHLIFTTPNGKIAIHLGMTGHFRIAPPNAQNREHHFLSLHWGAEGCSYFDFRRFSRVDAYAESRLALGGFDPHRGFSIQRGKYIETFLTELPGYASSPKISWLLRHGKRTGVGNYIANEAVGRLRLNPLSACASPSEAIRLLKTCGIIARESYKANGTSFGIGYYRIDGTPGTYADKLRFYRKSPSPLILNGRSVYCLPGKRPT